MISSSFRKRIEDAQKHEQDVINALLARDWFAEPFGQAMLSEQMRDHLRRVETSVRWMPDIIAAKNIAGKEHIVFIDAKAGERYKETGNHDIENAALESAKRWIKLSGDCPYFFVFGDGGVATPDDVLENGWDGTFRGSGSGTPFKLFPSDICRQFDTVFGERPSQSGSIHVLYPKGT